MAEVDLRFVSAVVLVASLAATGAQGARAPDQEEPDNPAPGLVAAYSATESSPPATVTVVPDLSVDWGRGAPDPRLPADGFRARWTGFLLIQAPGKHRFHARTDGTITLQVAGRTVLEGAGTVSSTAVDLPAGLAPIRVGYHHDRGEARIAVDWDGPEFRREPIPARLFYHDPASARTDDRFEQGRQLADRFGCANCHSLLDLPRHPHLGPPLAEAGEAIDRQWLAAWVADPTAVRSRTRMPSFGPGLSSNQVADLATFLASVKHKPASPTNEIRMALNVANPGRGRLLFRSLGCLACHTRDFPSDEFAPAGPDLTGLGRKRGASWIASYLARAKGAKSSGHRADLRVTPDESAHLAAYLVEFPGPVAPTATLPPGDSGRGRALAAQLRCAACHAIPGLDPPAVVGALTAAAQVDRGCLAVDPPEAGVPRFALTVAERDALRIFLSQLPAHPTPTAPDTLANDTIRRLNCLGCHTRDGQGGAVLGTRLALLLAQDQELGALKGTLTPPNLTAVGDKLRPEYLADAVRGAAPTARPWLSVRMPAFTFEPGETEAIVAFLRRHDRMSDEREPAEAATQPAAATVETAARLIGQQGFGCVSCHVIAGRIPPGGEPETLGPDLVLAHRRMTGRYFRRWLENPQRIIAGTPMPQFIKPVAGVPGTLDDQLAAVWQFLGTTRAAEGASSVARATLRRQGDRALVVFDMVLFPEAPGTQYTPRGLAIGLKNDHSLLFDADRLTWLGWWHQGFLSRTKSGRLWEWHPDGTRLWTTPARLAPVAFLTAEGKLQTPVEIRERFGRFSTIDFDGSRVTIAYILRAPGDADVEVRERIAPTAEGWERTVHVQGVPEALRAALVEMPPTGATREQAASAFSWTAGKSLVRMRLEGVSDAPRLSNTDPQARVFPMDRKSAHEYEARVLVSVDGR